jgi:CRP/FNR family transcriptional regulator, nitrogen oxide reductase regulator
MIGAQAVRPAAFDRRFWGPRVARRVKRSVHADRFSQTQPVLADMDLVARCGLFRGLSGEDLSDVCRRVRMCSARRGEVCFLQGSRAEEMYVLTSGTVKLVRMDADGRQVILRVVEPSELFGYVGMFDGGTHPVSAEAVHDSRFLAWDRGTVDQLMRVHPAIMRNGLRLLASHLDQHWERFHDLVTARIEQRIARTLLRLMHRQPEDDAGEPVDTVELLHQDLADLAGTNMYTVSRVLCRWKRLHIIETLRGRVIIRSLPKLAQLAGQPPYGNGDEGPGRPLMSRPAATLLVGRIPKPA